MSLPNLSGPRHEPASGRAPKKLIILLHGVGADGNDLIGLAPNWAKYLPDAEFVSPDAPFEYEHSDRGCQWFSLGDFSPETMLEGVIQAAPILNNFIDEQLALLGLEQEHLALVGFSQGTMMALFVALHRSNQIAGVVGYSGRMIGLNSDSKEVSARPPVLLIHGESDELIPANAMLETVQTLALYKVPTQWHICPNLGHGIDQTGLEIGGQFLQDVLSRSE